jgi:hypothetical protein
VIGTRILVNGYPLTIVGVSQAGFDGVEVGTSPQIRIPMTMKKEVTSFFDSSEESVGKYRLGQLAK